METINHSSNVTITGTDTADSILNGASDALNVLSSRGGMSVLISVGADDDTVRNYYGSYATILGDDNNDYIYNAYGSDISIKGGDGDDTIDNYYSEYVTIFGGNGNDSIYNEGVSVGYRNYVTINGEDGKDFVYNNSAYFVSLNGGADDDTVRNYFGNYSTINGGDGDDFIDNYSSYLLTINGGAGDDTISIESGRADLIEYISSDGDDIVYGYSWLTTLQITGTSISTTNSDDGKDVIIKVDNGSITLKDYAGSVTAVDDQGQTIVFTDADSDSDADADSDSDADADTDADTDSDADADTDADTDTDTDTDSDSDTDSDADRLNSRVDLSTVSDNSVGSFVVNQSSTKIGEFYNADFSDAIHHADHRYQLFSDLFDTWEEARDYAVSLGGHLAIINDDDENDELYNYMTLQGYQNAYFGLSDATSEGYWYWVDGTALENNTLNSHWGYDSVNNRMEPNSNTEEENYGMFYELTEPYKWNDGDFNPDYPRPFVVEWDSDNDTVVGTVSSDHVYSAVATLGSQNITVDSNWLVTASDFDDNITINGDGSTVSAGKGNDVVTISGNSARIVYNVGDGNDTVYGYSSDTTTLQFANGISTTSVVSGNDIIINASGSTVGSVTLKDVGATSTEFKKVEIIYIVDTSGSMGYYVSKIRDTASVFANYLVEQNVDFKLGLVEYDTTTSIQKYDFTSDVNTFISNVDHVLDNSFEDNQVAEYGLSAITDPDNGALSFEFDSDADKYFVVITDEGYWENGPGTSNIIDSDTVIASLQAANIQLDVLGRLRSKARYIPGYGYLSEDLDCQPEWESIATNTGGAFYDIDGNYDPSLRKIVLNTTEGKAIIVDLNLADGSTNGCFVLNDDSSMIAAFKTATVEGDTVVGFVNGDHIYAAAADSSRQEIRVTSGWNVTATDKKDEIKIYGSNTTITGGGNTDYVTINSEVKTVTLADLDVTEDELTFVSGIEPGDLDYSVENGQLKFSSEVLSFTLSDQSALTSDIKNYTVHNGGDENTIADLLYGTDTHRVSLSFINYGANPKRTYVTSLADIDEGFFDLTDGEGSRSLWGGADAGDDTLIGSDGYDEFFYFKGNGNDVIENADDDDLINLLNISLDDIDLNSFVHAIGDDSTTIKFNDGGSIKVNGTSQVGFKVANVDCTFCVKERQWAVK